MLESKSAVNLSLFIDYTNDRVMCAREDPRGPERTREENDLLPFYAILRSIPNKLLGVVFMLAALLILLAMPLLDTSRIRGAQFRPLMRFAFWVFVSNFVVLMYLGACHVEDPFITIGQISTVLYFAWFLVIVPAVGLLENTFLDLSIEQK